MNADGPYLSGAALCEAVLHEKDERISCIRFADQFEVTIGGDIPDPLPSVQFRLNALLAFKSGPFVGTKTIKIILKNPDGKIANTTQPQSYPAIFKGREHGANLIVSMDIVTDKSGDYAIDVFLDDEMFTQIPFKVTIKRMIPDEPQLPSS